MLKRITLLCTLCAGFASGLAQADTALESFLLKSYAEVQFGSASNSIDHAPAEGFVLDNTGDEFDFEDSFNAGIVAGYNFVEERNFDLSWEVSYRFFSETTGGTKSSSDLRIQLIENNLFWQSIAAGLRAKVMLNESLSAVVKIGFHHWYADMDHTVIEQITNEEGLTTHIGNNEFSTDSDGSDAYSGIGFQYHINKNIYAGLEYSNYKISPFDERGNVKSTALSVGFSF